MACSHGMILAVKRFFPFSGGRFDFMRTAADRIPAELFILAAFCEMHQIIPAMSPRMHGNVW